MLTYPKKTATVEKISKEITFLQQYFAAGIGLICIVDGPVINTVVRSFHLLVRRDIAFYFEKIKPRNDLFVFVTYRYIVRDRVDIAGARIAHITVAGIQTE